MSDSEIIEIMCREISAIGRGWRFDWSDFDGRTLRSQLDDICEWSQKAKAGETKEDFVMGTEFFKDKIR